MFQMYITNSATTRLTQTTRQWHNTDLHYTCKYSTRHNGHCTDSDACRPAYITNGKQASSDSLQDQLHLLYISPSLWSILFHPQSLGQVIFSAAISLGDPLDRLALPLHVASSAAGVALLNQ